MKDDVSGKALSLIERQNETETYDVDCRCKGTKDEYHARAQPLVVRLARDSEYTNSIKDCRDIEVSVFTIWMRVCGAWLLLTCQSKETCDAQSLGGYRKGLTANSFPGKQLRFQ